MKKTILDPKAWAASILGSAILAFGLYHVHSVSAVTEGGVLGMTLLLQHWLGLSPAITGFVMNALCYLLGWKMLGKRFLFCSAVSTVSFSAVYALCQQFPPLWPGLAQQPLLAAVLGALFVGIGAGLCVRVGGAPSGDDAMAMALSKATRLGIQWIYLASDLVVLVLSVSYIPLARIGYSLLTVLLSGQFIGLMQKIPAKPPQRD